MRSNFHEPEGFAAGRRRRPVMEPMRSMIFTPGHRHDLVAKAIRSGADGVIVDLEDAVALDEKANARAMLADLPGAGVQM